MHTDGEDRQVPRQPDRQEQKREATVRGTGKQGALSSSPPGFWPAASSSINSTQGNGEGGEGKNGERRGTSTGRESWRTTEVEEEDAASTIQRTADEGWENRTEGEGGRVVMEEEWRKRREREGFGDRYRR